MGSGTGEPNPGELDTPDGQVVEGVAAEGRDVRNAKQGVADVEQRLVGSRLGDHRNRHLGLLQRLEALGAGHDHLFKGAPILVCRHLGAIVVVGPGGGGKEHEKTGQSSGGDSGFKAGSVAVVIGWWECIGELKANRSHACLVLLAAKRALIWSPERHVLLETCGLVPWSSRARFCIPDCLAADFPLGQLVDTISD